MVKISMKLSKLSFSKNTPIEHKDLFQDTLSIIESENLGMYLGLPISHKRPSHTQVQFDVCLDGTRNLQLSIPFTFRRVL